MFYFDIFANELAEIKNVSDLGLLASWGLYFGKFRPKPGGLNGK